MSREEIMDDLQEPQQENYELEEFINEIRKYYKTHEFKRSAINDCVSRQAAIDAAECIVEHHSITPYKTMAAAMDHLKRILDDLPPMQLQQIKGRWIHDGYDIPHGVDWMHCSICGRREPYVPAAMTNYCPDCGHEMRGVEDARI